MVAFHSSSACLVFFPLSLCLARWFGPDLMNRRHNHATAVCVCLKQSDFKCPPRSFSCLFTSFSTHKIWNKVDWQCPGEISNHTNVQTNAMFNVTFCVQQWGAADAEIKGPFVENTEVKDSPFKAWSRSVCCHTCYAFCQGFLPYLFLPFWSIHLHFFQNLSQIFSCVGLQNKIGHPAGCRFPVLSARGI